MHASPTRFSRCRSRLVIAASLSVVTLSAASAQGQDTPVDSARVGQAAFTAVQQRGIDFLLKNQEKGRFFMRIPDRDGKATKRFDVGLTGLCLAAMQSKPVAKRAAAEQKVIDEGLTWILSQQSKVGAFGRRTIVYATSSVVFALTKSGRADCKKAAERALRFLHALQNTEGRGHARSDVDYGSYGYGGRERGDLSNTSFAIQAMRAAGLKKEDEGLARALVFLQRLQNLRSVNTLEHESKDPKTGKPVKVISGNDGGATYYPGASAAGFDELVGGSRIARSYGSMTYALLKTYTLCGIGKDDKRIKAAVEWVSRNWTVDINPGSHPKLGEKARYQGLYYYYMVMAQALDLVGVDRLTTAPARAKAGATAADAQPEPRAVDWRGELRKKLADLQTPAGSWRNSANGRWFESLDIICTAYAILALEHCN